MDAALSPSPIRWARGWSLLERALDRPAATAVELQTRPVGQTLVLGLAGAGMVVAAGLASAALLPAGAGRSGEAIWAMLLAWGVSAPLLVAAAGHFGLSLRPQTVMAVLAVALVTAGLVSVAAVPLLAYLALIPNGAQHTAAFRALLVPTLALAAGVVVPRRVLASLDGSRRAVLVGQLFLLTTATLFLLRVATTAPALFDLTR